MAFPADGGTDATTGAGGTQSGGGGKTGASGGAQGSSGATGSGGVTHTGGTTNGGGTINAGGAAGNGGAAHTGGSSNNGGTANAGGATSRDAGSDAAICRQSAVVLGAAAHFAVLAGSTVTSTGATSITGDVGVSPGTALTGFGPGIIVGTQHLGDPTSAEGIASLATAYDDAAGRTLCPVSVAGNLGGQTLPPGLYKSTSSLAISSGDLTLDAGGDGNAVFIFQMASTLTTTSGRQVILANGAKSANVFWQVGTSATLGSTSSFEGTIMADQAITLKTGATLDGRALARVAAVALDTNTIVRPAP